MITLRANRLHWSKDDGAGDPADLCAHSPVTCEVNSEVLARPEDGDWTVSASAIYLLRALDREHTKESKVGDQVFPCCGHGIFDVGEPEVAICGCASGIDFEIRHTETTFQLRTEDGRRIDVPKGDWRNAVLRYSGQIMKFYDQSAPKKPSSKEDRKGFAVMMSEWHRLNQKHTKAEQADAGNRRSAGA